MLNLNKFKEPILENNLDGQDIFNLSMLFETLFHILNTLLVYFFLEKVFTRLRPKVVLCDDSMEENVLSKVRFPMLFVQNSLFIPRVLQKVGNMVENKKSFLPFMVIDKHILLQ